MNTQVIENFLQKKYKADDLESGLYFGEKSEIVKFLGEYNEHLSLQEKLQKATDKVVSGIYEAQNEMIKGTIKTAFTVDAGFTEEMLKGTIKRMAESGWSMAFRLGQTELTPDNKIQVTGWVEWYLNGKLQTMETFEKVFRMFALSIYNAKIGFAENK